MTCTRLRSSTDDAASSPSQVQVRGERLRRAPAFGASTQHPPGLRSVEGREGTPRGPSYQPCTRGVTVGVEALRQRDRRGDAAAGRLPDRKPATCGCCVETVRDPAGGRGRIDPRLQHRHWHAPRGAVRARRRLDRTLRTGLDLARSTAHAFIAERRRASTRHSATRACGDVRGPRPRGARDRHAGRRSDAADGLVPARSPVDHPGSTGCPDAGGERRIVGRAGLLLRRRRPATIHTGSASERRHLSRRRPERSGSTS